MKGLANAVGFAATVIALACQTGANGQSLGQDLAGNAHHSGMDGVGSSAMDTLTVDGMASRHLQPMGGGASAGLDDALDVNGSPEQRALYALQLRNDLADTEFRASQATLHFNNGDLSSAATFHKTLPHDELGQVDPTDFASLTECIAEASFEKCEQVPAGDTNGFLIQPLGGIAVDMAGPVRSTVGFGIGESVCVMFTKNHQWGATHSSAIRIPSAPALNSEDFAAQMAEVYWMSLTRDVPFNKYGEDETTIAAADNLASMPGFVGMNGVAVGTDGRADPQSQLFRSAAIGVETGPMVSQLLVKDFTLDSMTVTPKQTTFAPGADYMTDYVDWLFIQNGGSPDSAEEEDSEKRYIRNARDLARLVATDTIYTEAFRAALILFDEDAINKGGFNGRYAGSTRQKGFVSYGVSHVMKILGGAEMTQRSSWYQKWNVHLFARPEAVAGTLHNVLFGRLNVDFDASLLENEELLERVAVHNAGLNKNTGRRRRSYMLSQATAGGSPAHPSYPAGHAVQNGAFATVLKALVGLERGSECFNEPVFPDDDGLTLLPYTGDDCLTYEGEINKMAVNIAFGRQMCGVHYRFDSQEGLLLGEIVGVRMLQQEVMTFPENQAYEFRLMAGGTIRLDPDGTFHLDGRQCSGYAFLGADVC